MAPRPPLIPAVPPGFGYGAVPPVAPPGADMDDEGPAAKRLRTEDALDPEMSWLARHPGPAPLQVCVYAFSQTPQFHCIDTITSIH